LSHRRKSDRRSISRDARSEPCSNDRSPRIHLKSEKDHKMKICCFFFLGETWRDFLPVAFSSSSPWNHQIKKDFNCLVNDGCRLDLRTVHKSQRFVLKIDIRNRKHPRSEATLPCGPCTRKKFGSQSNYPSQILCCHCYSNPDVR
jgi:hypothetical protein